MHYDGFRHNRRSIRLQPLEAPASEEGLGKPYPYMVGIFYVTICTHGRECLFGEVVEAKMHLNTLGEIVQEEWFNITQHRPNVTRDAFVVMPNHIHGIIILREAESVGVRQQFLQPQAGSLGMVVGGFKSAVSRRINALRDTPGAPVWQRGYHDKIARDERMLNNARRYIANNPAHWAIDVNNPSNVTSPT